VSEKVFGLRALERIGAPGAALIDEHDIALAQDARERRCHRGIEGGSTCPRAARQHEQWVRLFATADRAHPRDVQADLSPVGLGRILRHGERATLGRKHREAQRMLELARREGQHRRREHRTRKAERHDDGARAGPTRGQRAPTVIRGR